MRKILLLTLLTILGGASFVKAKIKVTKAPIILSGGKFAECFKSGTYCIQMQGWQQFVAYEDAEGVSFDEDSYMQFDLTETVSNDLVRITFTFSDESTQEAWWCLGIGDSKDDPSTPYYHYFDNSKYWLKKGLGANFDTKKTLNITKVVVQNFNYNDGASVVTYKITGGTICGEDMTLKQDNAKVFGAISGVFTAKTAQTNIFKMESFEVGDYQKIVFKFGAPIPETGGWAYNYQSGVYPPSITVGATELEITLAGSTLPELTIFNWNADPDDINISECYFEKEEVILPMSISSDEDWATFAGRVNGGETDLDAVLTADVNAGSTMVGNEYKKYAGTFDGAGHTLTFNYVGSSSMVAPFKEVDGATIIDLKTTGSITSSQNLLGGIVGQVNGATTLTRCASDMSITTTVGTNGRIGGLVARNGEAGSSLTLNNCMYNGAINSASNQAAGFVGWSPNATTISNCLVAASSITGGESNFAPNYITIPDGKYALYISKFGSSTQGTAVTDAQRYSGYVAYTLSSDISDGALFFGQGKLNSSVVELPSMTSDASKKVYKASNAELYANSDGLLPDPALSGKLAWKMAMTWDPIYFVTLPAASASNFELFGSADSYILNVSSAGATTLVVPFNVEEAKIPSGVKVYNLSFDGTDITATKVNSITANKPVLINAPKGEYRLESGISYNNIIDFSSYGTPTNGALTGVYNTSLPFSYVPEGAYVLQNGPEGLCFYQVDAENTIKVSSFRAYLTADALGARALSIKYPDDETAINQVQASNFKVQNSEIYNLAGQRMSKLQNGVNLVNGKKIMVK